jgi:molybdopterin converting factor small subunit
MVIEVRFFAALRKYIPSEPNGILSVDLLDGFTVSDLLKALEVEADEVKGISVNGTTVQQDALLSDGDRVGLFPEAGGA